MKFGNDTKKLLSGLTFGFLVMTGTYNAIVINSESTISSTDTRFAKRLDEVYGTIISKREVAASINWKKLAVKKLPSKIQPLGAVTQVASTSTEAQSSAPHSDAAVKEELSLNLSGVINPKLWQQGLTNDKFTGSLSTNEGVIESLNVSLPDGKGLSVSFSEMTGNVFEYDFQGELYSGMMYQEGQGSYIVSLTNGPLEGTRLTFTAEATLEQQIAQEDSQRELAENNESNAGVQPEGMNEAVPEAPAPMVAEQNYDQMLQEQALAENQAQGQQAQQAFPEGQAPQGDQPMPDQAAHTFNFGPPQAAM